MLFVPSASDTNGAVQVTARAVPICSATPLPPRSLTQVTRVILRSSLAVPAIFIALAARPYVPVDVGSRIDSVGTALSTRASASSRVAAFGSMGSLPPQATRTMQTAAIGVSLVLSLVVRVMVRAGVPGASWSSRQALTALRA